MAVQQEPSYRRNLGKVSYTYQDGGAQGEFMNACRMAAWRNAIEKHSISTDCILDVGCSYGSWAENWRALGFKKLHGIEPNSEAVEKARLVFDEVEHGFLEEVVGSIEPSETVAANGVIVHILEREAERRFLEESASLVAAGGHLLFSVINCEYYVTPAGREPFDGPNSCTRTLDHHRDVAAEAGLEIIDQIGTFINPWCLAEFDFVANTEGIKAEGDLWAGWEHVSNAHRPHTLVPFAEALFVARKN